MRTLDQVREVLAGTQSLETRPVADEAGRYAWIETTIKRFDYRCLKRTVLTAGSALFNDYEPASSGGMIFSLDLRWVITGIGADDFGGAISSLRRRGGAARRPSSASAPRSIGPRLPGPRFDCVFLTL